MTQYVMITIRPANERGGGNYGWLNPKHSFSFSHYWDPKWRDSGCCASSTKTTSPNTGFPAHPHRDMVIITYVLAGKLEHKDSLGTGSVILPGDGQPMTAGSGIRHSEFNPSTTEPVHLLQIWIQPEKAALPPRYEQKSFPDEDKRSKLRLIASGDASNGSVKINQDAKLYVTLLKPDEEVTHEFASGRFGWLQVARGAIELNGKKLKQGDGAAISDEKHITIKGAQDAEILLFDLAQIRITKKTLSS